jgi:hypothetical protein
MIHMIPIKSAIFVSDFPWCSRFECFLCGAWIPDPHQVIATVYGLCGLYPKVNEHRPWKIVIFKLKHVVSLIFQSPPARVQGLCLAILPWLSRYPPHLSTSGLRNGRLRHATGILVTRDRPETAGDPQRWRKDKVNVTCMESYWYIWYCRNESIKWHIIDISWYFISQNNDLLF